MIADEEVHAAEEGESVKRKKDIRPIPAILSGLTFSKAYKL